MYKYLEDGHEEGLFQCCPVPGQEVMGTYRNTKVLSEHKEKAGCGYFYFLMWGWQSIETSCLERWWSLHAQRCSKAAWRGPGPPTLDIAAWVGGLVQITSRGPSKLIWFCSWHEHVLKNSQTPENTWDLKMQRHFVPQKCKCWCVFVCDTRVESSLFGPFVSLALTDHQRQGIP